MPMVISWGQKFLFIIVLFLYSVHHLCDEVFVDLQISLERLFFTRSYFAAFPGYFRNFDRLMAATCVLSILLEGWVLIEQLMSRSEQIE